ncbi:putative NACHT [Triplophysa rosa]|uniref:NACHT n=1 Tax=Triplophysa rosa TaxID=992332 RepID=A0A9W7TBV6_TRIRA|nr:putative NACHT [Triplophysa rosa]
MAMLSGCMVTEEGCVALATALNTNPSHLRELDLRYNHPDHPGDLGVQLLSDRLKDPNYTLGKLNLDHGEACRIKPGLRNVDACKLTLDPNTANTHLIMSKENKKVTYVEDPQPYPEHPDRFEHLEQVEWKVWVRIAVTYKGICRKEGSISMFGLDDKSWSFFCTDTGFAIWHDNEIQNIHTPSHPSNRGVYLDWSAGTLSFYSVSDTETLTHIHTVNCKFTEPLHAGFMVRYKASLCHI